MDLKMSRATGDMLFVNGSTPVTEDKADSVAQKLYIMLRTFQGEWFLDIDHGIPYLQQILGQKTSREAVDLIFQQKILAEDGVQELVSFRSTLSADRVYSMSFQVRAFDEVITVQDLQVVI